MAVLIFPSADAEVTEIPWQRLPPGAVLQCSDSRQGLILTDWL